MVRRIYIHNYRCLENFELPIARKSSILLIGKNGSGKTSVALALKILQQIGRGTNRVGSLVDPRDLAGGRTDVPMRLEIEVELGNEVYQYGVAFDFPKGFKDLRVLDEKLTAGGQPVYTRQLAQVHLAKAGREREAEFRIDWHLVALPIIQQQSERDPLAVFKQWLSRMLLLRPVPSLIQGESKEETLQPNIEVTDFAAWLAGVLAHAPSAYTIIDRYLRQLMPDLSDIKNPAVGKDSRNLELHFSKDNGSLRLAFEDLSDGEKCFMICALVLAANEAYGPVLCFWDEPDNYLAISEVGHFVMALRKSFQSGGQLIATSHSREAIQTFSDENTFMLFRNSHLEPTIVRPLTDIEVGGDLVEALVRGDLEP